MEQSKILSLLEEHFPGQVRSFGITDMLTITLAPEKLLDIVSFLYSHEALQFQFLTTLCGVHIPDEKTIGVMYQLHNLQTNERLRLKVHLPEDKPEVDSITPVFKGANWMERETYDFFGVVFRNHPKLERILNVDEMIIFPLRKEYPLEDQTREDKVDEMFGR